MKLAALAVVTFVCWSAAVSAQTRAFLDADTQARLRRELGDADVALRRLGGADRIDRDAAREKLDRLSPSDRVLLARTALWSEDADVALGAATLLDWTMLDVGESRRFVEVTWPQVVALDTPFDFERFRRILGSASLDHVLADPPPLPREVFKIVAQTHQHLRAEHAPLLCRLALCDDSLVRKDAMEFLAVLADHTDRFRTNIAATVLGWPGNPEELTEIDPTTQKAPAEPRAFALSGKDDGWPPALCAVLRRLFVDEADPYLRRYRPWARRWAAAERAGPSDRDLLLELAAADLEVPRQIAIVGMRSLADADTARRLRELAAAADDDEAEKALALGALAGRDDAAARAQLAVLSARHPRALAVRLGVDPDAAIAELVPVACGDDAEAGLDALERFGHAGEVAIELPLDLPDETIDARLVAGAEAASLDPTRLGWLLRERPGCRTERLAARFLATGTAEDLVDGPAAALEVCDRAALVERLRSFRAEEDEFVRAAVLRLLMRLGDPDSAEAIVAWARADDEVDPHVLARVRAPAVETYLRELCDANEVASWEPDKAPGWAAPLTALAAFAGLDERLAASWRHDLESREPAPDLWRRVVELCVAKRPDEALGAWLDARPPAAGTLRELGRTALPRARTWLRSLADARHLGERWFALGELAVAGDADARAELRAACEAGLYGVVDSATTAALTRGEGLAAVPFWIAELETNCCRSATYATHLGELLEGDPLDGDGSPFATRGARTRAFWQRFHDRLAWSAIEDRWVVGPRP